MDTVSPFIYDLIVNSYGKAHPNVSSLNLFRCYESNEYKTDDNSLEFGIKQLSLNLKKAF